MKVFGAKWGDLGSGNRGSEVEKQGRETREQGLRSAEMFHVEHIHFVEFNPMFTT
jgi:hypothetical protein